MRTDLRLSSKLLVAAIAAFLAQPVVAEEIRIGAWNIEWLGFPDKRGRPGKDHPQAPQDLANYIHASHVDVLSLEEIGIDDTTPPYKNATLDSVFDLLKSKHGESWKYVLFPKTHYPPDTEEFVQRGQHLGLAWRTDKATMVGSSFEVPVGTNSAYGIKFWERRANAVKLSFGQGRTDVVFLPIHLKSNRNEANPADEQFTQKQRAAETTALLQHLNELQSHFADQDIVILGDTNVLAGETTTFQELRAQGFKDLNAAEHGSTAAWGVGYSSAPFDRILVPPQPEFAQSKQVIHILHDGSDQAIMEYRRKLSDHYLVWCTVQIGMDDD